MGQAKMRGTKEARVARAVQRAQELRADRLAEKARQEAVERERIAIMPPDVRRRYIDARHRSQMMVATLMGLAYGLTDQLRGTRPRK